MHLLTADIADGIRWLADLIPLIAALLLVLVLFELAILLGTVIATRGGSTQRPGATIVVGERSARRRSEDAAASPPGPARTGSRPDRPAQYGSGELSQIARSKTISRSARL